MKLIVGLGNPGSQYRFSRHNAGFLVVEKLAEDNGIAFAKKGFDALYGKGSIQDIPVVIAKPQTFMNLSGVAVRGLYEFFKIDKDEDLIVAHDDLDLPFLTLRLKAGGGHGGHKGLQSIIEQLGSAAFSRIRLGIGRPTDRMSVDTYVLSPFSPEERVRLPAVVTTAARAAADMISLGIQAAMNRYNGKAINNFNEEV
ncbi:MAG: aminoacyl-tRNA hydrolase [Syntrophales bacterium]|nr:aminoacyl-tRNA hydrolase [Syntrophales bacterium]